MSFLSGIRERVSRTLDEAADAASTAASKAREAVTSIAAAAKASTRAAAEPPAPSSESVAHAQRAAADAARNSVASPPRKTPAGKEAGIYMGFGASAMAGADTAVGGQASAGYLVGFGGTMKTYGSTGAANGGFGAGAGAGFEVGFIGNVDEFYGDGHQVSGSFGPLSGSLSFNRDKELTGGSFGVAESIGAGGFMVETHTEDTTGR